MRVLGLSGAVVAEYHPDTVAAVVEAADPDVVVATPPDATTVGPALTGTDRPVLLPGRGVAPAVETGSDGGVVVSLTGNDEAATLRDAADRTPGSGGSEGADAPRCVVSDALSLSVDPYERSTSVDGLAEYRDRVPDAWHATAVHVVTTLRAGHTATVAGPTGALSLVGVGTTSASLGAGVDGRVGDPTVASVYANGAVTTTSVDPESVGLRGVRGVGAARAATLRDHGYTAPADLADAGHPEIAGLDGFGRSTARSVRRAARAVTDRRVLSTGDGSLPRGDPVYVDIETDGLEPSTAWLVGVLDGGREEGRYLAFRQRAPDDTSHLDGFITWLTGSAAGRPVVAWNGYQFDFPVIADQLRQHCPDRLQAWNDTYQFDPLYWARDQGNAALPGRSNRLEVVAEALGWEPTTTGLDGQTAAECYVGWRTELQRAADRAAVDPPPWDRLERYCEDDVRALATVYEALRAAEQSSDTTTRPTDENGAGRQGALSEFG
ncbi:MAG: ribonuclease H-like domain-containing protein [Haloferacaceae archaeon]